MSAGQRGLLRLTAVSAVLCLTLVAYGHAQGAHRACSATRDLAVTEVSILGQDGRSTATVPTDTLWIPAERRLADPFFVRVSMSYGSSAQADSVYVSVMLRVMLVSGPPGSTPGGRVPFLTGTLRDTVVALTRRTVVTLGPFSTRALVPWPGIAVQAAANALPVTVTAQGQALRISRQGPPCVEPLRNNQARSREVKLIFAY